jgi:L-ascorbate metabolism protein UlaG (beta-lactamase superfamily)
MSYLKRAEKSDGKFLNPVPTQMSGFGMAFKVLWRMLTEPAERMPRTPVGPFRTDAGVYATPPASGLRVTWFGHSALLMEIDGVRLLVDPVWEERASPFQWMGPKRFFPPTLRMEDLPALDVILISHNHYDHLGANTLRKLAKLPAASNATWVTSLGVGAMLRKLGVAAQQIQELDWTQSAEVAGAELGSSLKLTAWPARHFSGRGLGDRFKTLWSSFVFEGPKHRIYFGADSGWWDGFAEIAAQYDGFDLTLLEIGAFDPAWGNIHLGPDHAARAYQAMGGAVKAGLLMPIHWGLFSLALHGWRQPMERLEVVAAEQGIPLWSPLPGVPTEVDGAFWADWWQAETQKAVDSSCNPVENGVQRV